MNCINGHLLHNKHLSNFFFLQISVIQSSNSAVGLYEIYLPCTFETNNTVSQNSKNHTIRSNFCIQYFYFITVKIADIST